MGLVRLEVDVRVRHGRLAVERKRQTLAQILLRNVGIDGVSCGIPTAFCRYMSSPVRWKMEMRPPSTRIVHSNMLTPRFWSKLSSVATQLRASANSVCKPIRYIVSRLSMMVRPSRNHCPPVPMSG